MAKVESAFPKAIYIGATTRTPIGKFGGALKRFSAGELASITLKEAVRRVEAKDGSKARIPEWVFTHRLHRGDFRSSCLYFWAEN